MAKEISAVLEKPGKLMIREFEIPEIDADGILIKVEIAGICGTDVKMYKGEFPKGYFGPRQDDPHIPGDEMVGRVAALGRNAATHYHVKEGDRVIVEPKFGCGHCQYCLAGYFAHCKESKTYGTIPTDIPPSLWGAYGQYMYVAPISRIHKVPEGMSREAACLASVVLANGVRWVEEKGKVKIGDTVLILGPGPQGLATTAAAKVTGAGKIIVVGLEKDKKRLQIAKKLGADHVIEADKCDLTYELNNITNGQLADVVFECVGSEETIKHALEYVKLLGTCVLVGITDKPYIPIPTVRIQRNEIDLVGGRGHRPWFVERAMKMVSSGVPIESMITHKFQLTKAPEAMKMAAGESEETPVKVVLEIDDNL